MLYGHHIQLFTIYFAVVDCRCVFSSFFIFLFFCLFFIHQSNSSRITHTKTCTFMKMIQFNIAMIQYGINRMEIVFIKSVFLIWNGKYRWREGIKPLFIVFSFLFIDFVLYFFLFYFIFSNLKRKWMFIYYPVPRESYVFFLLLSCVWRNWSCDAKQPNTYVLAMPKI